MNYVHKILNIFVPLCWQVVHMCLKLLTFGWHLLLFCQRSLCMPFYLLFWLGNTEDHPPFVLHTEHKKQIFVPLVSYVIMIFLCGGGRGGPQHNRKGSLMGRLICFFKNSVRFHGNGWQTMKDRFRALWSRHTLYGGYPEPFFQCSSSIFI